MFISAAKPYAWKLNLIDRPAGRKQHDGDVPIIGGLAIYCAFFLGTTLEFGLFESYAVLLAVMGFLVMIGMVDDAIDLSPTIKIAAQLLAAISMLTFGNVPPISGEFGPLLGNFGLLAGSLFTVFLILLTINAINMVDGVDGLSGGLVTVSLAWLGVAAALNGSQETFTIAVRLMVPVIAFLAFNLRAPWRKQASVFMGDAGTMMLGCAIAWLCLELVGQNVPLLACGLVVAIPVADTISLFFRRVFAGKNPFHADRQHLHHLLLAAGVDAAVVPILLISVAAVLGGVGIIGSYLHLSEYVFAVVWLLVFVGHAIAVSVLCHRAANSSIVVPSAETVR